jgi:hypothetical protein
MGLATSGMATPPSSGLAPCCRAGAGELVFDLLLHRACLSQQHLAPRAGWRALGEAFGLVGDNRQRGAQAVRKIARLHPGARQHRLVLADIGVEIGGKRRDFGRVLTFQLLSLAALQPGKGVREPVERFEAEGNDGKSRRQNQSGQCRQPGCQIAGKAADQAIQFALIGGDHGVDIFAAWPLAGKAIGNRWPGGAAAVLMLDLR